MKPVTHRLWELRGPEPEAAAAEILQRQLTIPPLLARLLLVRGLNAETAGAYLKGNLGHLPDPDLLPDMGAAVARLFRAIGSGEKIAVHGDYDVDGMTGTALLVEGLRACGGQVDYHIPLRLVDGYGLSADALRQAADSDIAVVISVDCGVSALEEARLAAELGLDLIITDHHQPPAELPKALAVVNPQREDSQFPFRNLAGVGVAFFLLVALRRKLRQEEWFAGRSEPDLRTLLDLVALGTIADLVPLQGVNRLLTRTGLQLIEQDVRPGLRALRKVAAVKEVNCGTVGYQLAPRLNAAGRLADGADGVRLLLAADEREVHQDARSLDRFNRERREIERQTFEDALEMIEQQTADDACSITLARQGWHAGVIGIVASRLVERFNRPTVLIALDGEAGKASARSIPGFHLFRELQACAASLQAFGGHEMAAGLSLAASRVEEFTAAFEARAAAMGPALLVPRLRYDGEAGLDEISLDAVRAIETMAPFGMGNAEPLLAIREVRAHRLEILGEKHLRFLAVQGGYSHPAIAFNMAERIGEFGETIDLLAVPQVNRWRGREAVQLKVKDVRAAQTS